MLTFFNKQSSTSDLYVSWDSFVDVEEYDQAVHSSGIKEYQVGLGKHNVLTLLYKYICFNRVSYFDCNSCMYVRPLKCI